MPAPALLVAVVPPPPDLDTVEEKWFAYLDGKMHRHLSLDQEQGTRA